MSSSLAGRATPSPRFGLDWALLAYAIALAVFLLVPPTLRATVGPPVAFTQQEAADVFTPIVVLPLAWLALQRAGGLGGRGMVLFVVVAAVWVEGHGIHLAANAIGDAYGSTVQSFYATVPGDLDHWLDEILGHWMWHIGWVAMSILFILAAVRAGRDPTEHGGIASTIGGLVHGATFFVVTVEGETYLLGIPWSVAALAWAALALSRAIGRRPIAIFFVASSVITLIGYFVWAALNGWTLPGFYEKGLIH